MPTESMFDVIESDHMVEGTAVDAEKIIQLRPQIEDEVRRTWGDFDHTDLYWNWDHHETENHKIEGLWVYQLHFFKEPKKNDSKRTDS